MTRKAELAVVAREGKRVRTKLFDVRALPSPLSHPRVAIVVAKHRRTTSDRNRLKRRVREIVRLCILPRLQVLDLLIRIRQEAYSASFSMLHGELVQAAQCFLISDSLDEPA